MGSKEKKIRLDSLLVRGEVILLEDDKIDVRIIATLKPEGSGENGTGNTLTTEQVEGLALVAMSVSNALKVGIETACDVSNLVKEHHGTGGSALPPDTQKRLDVEWAAMTTSAYPTTEKTQ